MPRSMDKIPICSSVNLDKDTHFALQP